MAAFTGHFARALHLLRLHVNDAHEDNVSIVAEPTDASEQDFASIEALADLYRVGSGEPAALNLQLAQHRLNRRTLDHQQHPGPLDISPATISEMPLPRVASTPVVSSGRTAIAIFCRGE